jgi:hypothetical protein
MRSMYSLLLSFTVACSGCVCWFVPCDRRLHVSGHAFDNQHHPVSQASVTFYGVTKETPEDGCFYFDGLLAAQGLNVQVVKAGYKPYREGKEFAYFDIEVTLEPENSDRPSSGSWRELSRDELSKYKACAGR